MACLSHLATRRLPIGAGRRLVSRWHDLPAFCGERRHIAQRHEIELRTVSAPPVCPMSDPEAVVEHLCWQDAGAGERVERKRDRASSSTVLRRVPSRRVPAGALAKVDGTLRSRPATRTRPTHSGSRPIVRTVRRPLERLCCAGMPARLRRNDRCTGTKIRDRCPHRWPDDFAQSLVPAPLNRSLGRSRHCRHWRQMSVR